jgi:hypothetical protein
VIAIDEWPQRHALLARAAVDVAEQVDAGGDGVVEPDPAGGRHAPGGDGRRLRPVVDRCDESSLQ